MVSFRKTNDNLVSEFYLQGSKWLTRLNLYTTPLFDLGFPSSKEGHDKLIKRVSPLFEVFVYSLERRSVYSSNEDLSTPELWPFGCTPWLINKTKDLLQSQRDSRRNGKLLYICRKRRRVPLRYFCLKATTKPSVPEHKRKRHDTYKTLLPSSSSTMCLCYTRTVMNRLTVFLRTYVQTRLHVGGCRRVSSV